MEPRRYLRCLGQPALFAATGEPIRFRTKKHLALLVYLAVEPRRPHTRERLAELLWPTGSRSEARHSLATALSILRPRVGAEVLETDRERVLLLPNAVAMDLDRLAAGDILGSEVVPPLEVAAFLDGFDIPESGEFTLWKDRQQARLLPANQGRAGDPDRSLPPHRRLAADRAAGGSDAGAGRAERGGDPREDGGAGVCGGSILRSQNL